MWRTVAELADISPAAMEKILFLVKHGFQLSRFWRFGDDIDVHAIPDVDHASGCLSTLPISPSKLNSLGVVTHWVHVSSSERPNCKVGCGQALSTQSMMILHTCACRYTSCLTQTNTGLFTMPHARFVSEPGRYIVPFPQ
jgi:hypothetical protein